MKDFEKELRNALEESLKCDLSDEQKANILLNARDSESLKIPHGQVFLRKNNKKQIYIMKYAIKSLAIASILLLYIITHLGTDSYVENFSESTDIRLTSVIVSNYENSICIDDSSRLIICNNRKNKCIEFSNVLVAVEASKYFYDYEKNNYMVLLQTIMKMNDPSSLYK